MRPQEMRRRIMNVLWNRFVIQKRLNKMSFDQIINELKSIEKELKEAYVLCVKGEYRFAKEYNSEPDLRTGFETYGYKTLESIKGNLEYISDRRNCTFRIRWILDLIDHKDEIKRDLILHTEETKNENTYSNEGNTGTES